MGNPSPPESARPVGPAVGSGTARGKSPVLFNPGREAGTPSECRVLVLTAGPRGRELTSEASPPRRRAWRREQRRGSLGLADPGQRAFLRVPGPGPQAWWASLVVSSDSDVCSRLSPCWEGAHHSRHMSQRAGERNRYACLLGRGKGPLPRTLLLSLHQEQVNSGKSFS